MSYEVLPIQGLVLTNIDVGADEIWFYADLDQRTFKMHHPQDCCENVYVEEVIGDIKDLIGTPLLVAECRTNRGGDMENGYESITWTFYEFRTVKGSVTIRWCGTSNGYYSESVEFDELSYFS